MRVTPRTPEELQALNLISPGVYDYQVIEAKDRISKSGNEMIELRLRVWDEKGSERTIFDYLLDSMSHKIRHFSEVNDLLDKYNSGEIEAMDCIGKAGKVEIVIQKDKTGMYGDKNSVKDYVTKDNLKITETVVNNEFDDKDIPF